MHGETNYYGPTAARKNGRLGREIRPSSITINMHSHVLLPEADAFVQPRLDLSTIPLAHFVTPNTRALSRKQEVDRRPQLTDVEARLADMDATGVDMQIVMARRRGAITPSRRRSASKRRGWSMTESRNSCPSARTALLPSGPCRCRMAPVP